MSDTIIERITSNPDICHGRPTIRNTRYTVDLVLDLMGAGMSEEEIMVDYPAIEKEDIRACLLFASKLSKFKSIHRISA